MTAAARVRRTSGAITGRKPATAKMVGSTAHSKARPGKAAAKNVAALLPSDDLSRVREALDDMKAQNVVVIPLAGQASFADYLVIASGTSTRHVSSMGRALDEKLGKAILGMEGLQEGEWVCADLGDIVVHIFVPEKRVLYNLEKLWSHVFTAEDSEITTR